MTAAWTGFDVFVAVVGAFCAGGLFGMLIAGWCLTPKRRP